MDSKFTEKNREIFDKKSRSYRDDFEESLKTLHDTAILQRHWASQLWADTEAGQERDIKMLEYACGPGNISRALAPFVTRITGIDISDGMLDEYKKNAQEAGFADKMVGIKADLLAEIPPAEISGPEFFDFDIVVVSMALHHFEKPDQAMIRLGQRLKKGGVCIIIDIVADHHDEHWKELGADNDVSQTISKHGFTREDMKKLFEDAGVGLEFKHQVIDDPLVFKKDGKHISKTFFMARGEKA